MQLRIFSLKNLFSILTLFFAISSFSQKDLDQMVEEKLNQLTLADKVGEMTQLSIDVLMEGQPYNIPEPQNLDSKKLQQVLVDLKVGSILNVAGHAYTRERWEEIITTIQDYAMNKKSSGIPVLFGIDAIHGANYTHGSTLFPQQIGQAATWNVDIAKSCGEVTAYETRASGIPWDFAPVLDIGRNPLWSRWWETYGEDVHLASMMGKNFIEGLEGDDISSHDRVASCMKHFMGYSLPIRGKDRTQAWIPERQLREYVMPTFQTAIDAGAKTIMICSGEINGIPVHADSRILTDILRGEMGFKGLAVTDWEDIIYLYTRHRVATDFKDAIRISINAGIDMAMVPMRTEFTTLLKELVLEGKVPIERINESVRRILKLKYELGLFKKPYFDYKSYPKFGGKEHTQIALDAARESIILAKNNNILPLKKGAKILVTGPTANNILAINGGWSRTWQGNAEEHHEKDQKTILDAINLKYGKENVKFSQGATVSQITDLQEVTTYATQSDVIIACLGEMTYTEKPGDIDDLDLSPSQIELFQTLKRTGKPIILVMIQGRPRVVREIVDDAAAVLVGFLPGNQGGTAMAEIIAGEVNPSGKFPVTYPKYSNDIVNYDHKGTDLVHRDFSMNGFNPQWEFGFGLSYTTFNYNNLNVDYSKWLETGKLYFSVEVTNSGTKSGKEVVQLYLTDKVASITPSVKRLRAFEKIELKAGETRKVSFTLTKKDLSFIGQNNTWITEPGDYDAMIGDQKSSFYLDK